MQDYARAAIALNAQSPQPVGAVVADEDRQTEAHKLARILFGMVEGDGRVEGADIYADGCSAPDGDVYVLRAAELLIEQAAESKELTRYVEHFALASQPAKPAEVGRVVELLRDALGVIEGVPSTYGVELAERIRDALAAQTAAPQAVDGEKPVAWRVGVTGNWVYHSTYEDAKKETDDHYTYYGEDAGEYEEPEPVYLAAHHSAPEAAQAVDEREAFEAWALGTGEFVTLIGAEQEGKPWRYFDDEAQDAWIVWQAGRASLSKGQK